MQARQVARYSATAQKGLPGRHSAEDREGKGERTAGGIAAHKAQVAPLGHGAESPGQRFQPSRLDGRQGQRQGEAQGRGAHGGQVAGAHRQGALAEFERMRTGIGKVHPGGQGIGGYRQLLAGRKRQQRAVVTYAQGHAGTAAGAERRGELTAA